MAQIFTAAPHPLFVAIAVIVPVIIAWDALSRRKWMKTGHKAGFIVLSLLSVLIGGVAYASYVYYGEKNGRTTPKKTRRTSATSSVDKEPNYNKLVSGTVKQTKKKLKNFDGDWEQVLEAEKAGKNRKTLKKYIKEQMNN